VVKSSTKTREYFARPIVAFEIGKSQQFHAEPYICAPPAGRPSRPKLNPTEVRFARTLERLRQVRARRFRRDPKVSGGFEVL
jgi:hypothetical protein